MSWFPRLKYLIVGGCLLACGGRSQQQAPPVADAGSSSDSGTNDSPSFIQVACGETNACALRSDGDVSCWGSSLGQPPPQGPFVALAGGGGYACALRGDGTISCWGLGFPMLPAGTYSAVSAEMDGLVCALDAGGAAVCRLTYPVNDSTVVSLPGSFTALAPGQNDVCGLTPAGSVVCANTTGLADPSWQDAPSGVAMKQLTCGTGFCCGIAMSGQISCWGDATPNGERDAPTGTFRAIAAAVVWPCAEHSDGTITCWGKGWKNANQLPTGAFGNFCVGWAFGCGIRAGGTVSCWGLDKDGAADPPSP